MIWPDFCSAFIVRRLVPLDLHNTRFPPLPVSRSPMTGAAASSSATRPTGTSPVPDRPGRGTFCISIPARSCTRRRRIRPWRCRTGPSPVPLAGLVAAGVLPRLTPQTPSSLMVRITWSRPTSPESQPCEISRALVFRCPCTAMKKSEWIWRMPHASASRRACMGLTDRFPNMR